MKPICRNLSKSNPICQNHHDNAVKPFKRSTSNEADTDCFFVNSGYHIAREKRDVVLDVMASIALDEEKDGSAAKRDCFFRYDKRVQARSA